MDQVEVIRNAFSDLLLPIIQYPYPLPDDLKSWYCYPKDMGHCILVLIKNHFDPDSPDLSDYVVPCPVKAVLKDYYLFQGIPVASVMYSEQLGIEVEDSDYEY